LCAVDAACDAWDRSSGRAPVLRKVNRTAAPWLPFTTTFRPRSASKPSCGLREIKSLLKENVSGARATPKKPSKFQERDFVLFKNNKQTPPAERKTLRRAARCPGSQPEAAAGLAPVERTLVPRSPAEQEMTLGISLGNLKVFKTF